MSDGGGNGNGANGSRLENGHAELLVFELGKQAYALPAIDVVELVRAVAIAALPHAPPVVEGVVNLRGRVIPVFDLRIRFGLPSPVLEPSDHFIIARAGERVVGIRADRATQLVQVSPADVEDASRMVAGTRYVAGVAKLPDGLVMIHDLRAFLSEAEATMLDQAMETTSTAPGQA